MKNPVKLIAQRDFNSLKKGDKFMRNRGLAKALVRVGRATYDNNVQEEVEQLNDALLEEAHEEAALPRPRKKRTYKRRDLKAEDGMSAEDFD